MAPCEDASMRVAAVILAAGASTRMGTNKMLLALDGEPLIRRAVRTARDAGCHPILTVSASGENAVRAAVEDLGVEFVTNDDSESPPGRSLQLALEQLGDRADATVLCLADMVDVTSGMLNGLRAAAAEQNAQIVMSRYGEVTAPPHLIHQSLFATAIRLPPDRLVRQLAEDLPDSATTVSWPAGSLTDIDTPEDLDAVRTRTG